MIKGINSSSPYVQVNGGQPGSIYVNLSGVNPATGQVRYTGQDLEVFDGNVWQRIMTNYVDIRLSPVAEDAINWALDKMRTDRELEARAKENVTVADALAQYKKAAEQLSVVLTLTKE